MQERLRTYFLYILLLIVQCIFFYKIYPMYKLIYVFFIFPTLASIIRIFSDRESFRNSGVLFNFILITVYVISVDVLAQIVFFFNTGTSMFTDGGSMEIFKVKLSIHILLVFVLILLGKFAIKRWYNVER